MRHLISVLKVSTKFGNLHEAFILALYLGVSTIYNRYKLSIYTLLL